MNPSSMRCMLCGADMVLIGVVEDDTLMVSGFERHTYMCSSCSDIERRFVFRKHESERTDEPTLVPTPSTAPSGAAADTADRSTASTAGMFSRMLSRIRSGH